MQKKCLLLILIIPFLLHGGEYSFPVKPEQADLSINAWFWDGDDKEERVIKTGYDFDDILDLEEKLNKRIIGQEHAICMTCDAILRYAAGLSEEHTPVGTFLYVGPTGVGKTQLAKELARELLGSEEKVFQLNMSEFVTEHSFTRLIGSPPGYINSEQGGVLTNTIKENPYSIILLDEFDKAHPKVQKLFLQAFDEGVVRSAMGEVIDCSNVIFICTTNYSAQEILDLSQCGCTPEEILEFIEPNLLSVVVPELYNRLDTVVFLGLKPEVLHKIVTIFLEKLSTRVKEKKNIRLEYDVTIVDYLKEHGYHPSLGARPLRRLIEKDIVTIVSRSIIKGEVKKGDTLRIAFDNGKVITQKMM